MKKTSQVKFLKQMIKREEKIIDGIINEGLPLNSEIVTRYETITIIKKELLDLRLENLKKIMKVK